MRITSAPFQTDDASAGTAGTVHGHANTRNRYTCDAPCLGSCADTCQYTCKCQPTQPEETRLYPSASLSGQVGKIASSLRRLPEPRRYVRGEA